MCTTSTMFRNRSQIEDWTKMKQKVRGFRAHSSKGVDKNRAKCNTGARPPSAAAGDAFTQTQTILTLLWLGEEVKGFGRSSSEIQDPTSGQEDRVVQEFPRKSSQASRSSGGSHGENHGREGGVLRKSQRANAVWHRWKHKFECFLPPTQVDAQSVLQWGLEGTGCSVDSSHQCGWEMVHLHWTIFLLYNVPMSRTWTPPEL